MAVTSLLRTNRVDGIDAARGTAMLLVCLSHFADVYFTRPEAAPYRTVLIDIGLTASPMFIGLSATTVGLLYAVHAEEFGRVTEKLVDRAIFLLTIGHVLICLCSIANMAPLKDAWRILYITDVIAICVIAACALLPRLTPRARIAFGLSAYAASWVVVCTWHPMRFGPALLENAIFGPFRNSSWVYAVPILPWLGVYSICTVFGERLGRLYQDGRSGELPFVLLRVGSASALVAVVTKALYLYAKLRHVLPNGDAAWRWYLLTTPLIKNPPSPDYLLFYGGSGMVLTATLLLLEQSRGFAWLLGWVKALGRSSLFAFILQYFIYYTLLVLLRPASRPFALLWLVGSIVLLISAAVQWDRFGCNRFLSVRRIHQWARITVGYLPGVSTSSVRR